jgi:two-component system, chemotaxis family, sensor kinase CheA
VSADPYKYFRIEARELLEQLGGGMSAVEHEDPGGPGISRLLRLAHTLKGAARVVRQAEIAGLAHDIEDRLEPFREAGGPVPRGDVAGLLELVDAIGDRVRALSAPADSSAPPAADEAFRTMRADVGEMDDLLDGVAETQTLVGELRRTVGVLRKARRPAGAGGDGAARLQGLLGQVEGRLEEAVQGLERELEQVRSAGERLRLVPIGTLFASLERVVGDTARSLGKRARFRGAGASIRLDGPVLEALQAALVQAVRNAVAHGLEQAADRVAAGKAAEGEVVVEVSTRGSRVAVTCRDDGRGVDLPAVRAVLQRKGAISIAEALSPDDLLSRLLGGGITTSAAVSQAAGRGVGLDVVREVTERLGGEASLQSTPGQGTRLELVVPVSLSSLDALVVEASGITAAIPVSAVRHTLRLEARSATEGPGSDTILYQGNLVPLAPLAPMLAPRDVAAHRPRSGVVVSSSGGTVALGVDRVLGRETVLVRAVPGLAAVDPLVSGLTLDREGDPQPVLDPERLIENAGRRGTVAAAPATPRAPILVVDDSLTTRMLEQSILESAGYTVELASSAEEALVKARRQRYGLFLVDVEMPGMDGFTLLERLRADPALNGIPAVLVTSRQSHEDRARGFAAGARAYIVKSEFNQADLLDRIRALVE